MTRIDLCGDHSVFTNETVQQVLGWVPEEGGPTDGFIFVTQVGAEQGQAAIRREDIVAISPLP